MKIINYLFFLPFVVAKNGTVHYQNKRRNLRDNGIITFYDNFENACQFENIYNNHLKIAISGDEWNNGEKCGSCLEIIGTGNGIGTTPFQGYHKGIITNICPECPSGHFDLLMDGNGIWDIEYNFIPCNNIDIILPPIQYRLDINNEFYLRLQVINTKTEIKNIYLEGDIPMEKTFDNFWVHYNPMEIDYNPIFQFPISIKIELENGEIKEGEIYNNENYTNL